LQNSNVCKFRGRLSLLILFKITLQPYISGIGRTTAVTWKNWISSYRYNKNV